MGQASDRLRKKFFHPELNDDGIGRCEDIIEAHGGYVEFGVIHIDDDLITPEVQDAIDFLINEWDYARMA